MLPLYGFWKVLTILRDTQPTPVDPPNLALAALGWVLADGQRAERLLALTGLTPDALRDGLGDPAVLGAVLDFLGSHEPDLVAASDQLGVRPEQIIAARRSLES